MENKTNFVLILIIAFLSMAVAFIVIYMVVTGGNSKTAAGSKDSLKEQKKVEIDYKKAVYYSVPEMLINLKSGGNNPKSIIKIEVGVLLNDKKFEEDFKAREMEVRDIIRSTFNDKVGDDVIDDKIDSVAQELLVKFKAMYKDPKDSANIIKVLIPASFVQ